MSEPPRRPGGEGTAAPAGPLLRVRGLVKHFDTGRRTADGGKARVQAVDGVGFDLDAGETLGIVGESGSGKSTLARLVMRLLEPDSGSILLDGTEVTRAPRRTLRRLRSAFQMVFQDPTSSLDPTKSVGDAISEPLRVHRRDNRDGRQRRVGELLSAVGLSPDYATRFPRELSGGQRQRVSMARALALQPKLIVADEPTSALDVSTRAEILNMLLRLQKMFGVAYLLISHDFSTIGHLSDRIGVMYLGRIVELGPSADVAGRPLHPYTQALLSAVPTVRSVEQRERVVLLGELPDPADPPKGCRFHTRCPYAMEICRVDDPPLVEERPGTVVACHLHAHGPRLQGESVLTLSPSDPRMTPFRTPVSSSEDAPQGGRPADQETEITTSAGGSCTSFAVSGKGTDDTHP